MFAIKSLEKIKKEIIGERTQATNFPKSADFPFDELYREIVTRIETAEISSECILYDSVESANTTKAYSDEDYWSENTDKSNIKNYWFIGQNGQGDYWIMDVNGKICFYDHSNGAIDLDKMINLNIDFGKWLQYAYLNRELDNIYFEGRHTKEIGKAYKEMLKELSEELFENYPFDVQGEA
jgi:hypothetical protein